MPADRNSDKEDGGSEPSNREGHDLLHSSCSRETQSASPSLKLAKVGRDTCTQHIVQNWVYVLVLKLA